MYTCVIYVCIPVYLIANSNVFKDIVNNTRMLGQNDSFFKNLSCK